MKENGSGFLVFVMMLGLIGLLFFITYYIIEDTEKYSQNLLTTDCLFIGVDKDLPQIKYLDCNGEIRLIKNLPKSK